MAPQNEKEKEKSRKQAQETRKKNIKAKAAAKKLAEDARATEEPDPRIHCIPTARAGVDCLDRFTDEG